MTSEKKKKKSIECFHLTDTATVAMHQDKLHNRIVVDLVKKRKREERFLDVTSPIFCNGKIILLGARLLFGLQSLCGSVEFMITRIQI